MYVYLRFECEVKELASPKPKTKIDRLGAGRKGYKISENTRKTMKFAVF